MFTRMSKKQLFIGFYLPAKGWSFPSSESTVSIVEYLRDYENNFILGLEGQSVLLSC